MKVIVVIILLLISSALYLIFNHTKTGCDYRNGKWGSVASSCVTRSCYNNSSCGKWAAPIYWCPNLKIGNSIQEVYFQLGQPESVNGTNYEWNAAKASSEKIRAIISNNRLIEIQCKTIQQAPKLPLTAFARTHLQHNPGQGVRHT